MSHPLYEVLFLLDAHSVHYRLDRYLPDAVTVTATLVGARLEINVRDDGEIETSVFAGDESLVTGLDYIQDLLKRHGE